MQKSQPPIVDAEFEVISDPRLQPKLPTREPFFAVPVSELLYKLIVALVFLAIMYPVWIAAHWITDQVLH